MMIKKIEIRLSLNDLSFDHRARMRPCFTTQPTTIWGDGFRLLQHLPFFNAGLTAVGRDNLEILDNFWKECSEAYGKLDRIWLEKLKVIGVLDLDYLLVDAREAYGLDGASLHQTICAKFSGGFKPAGFRILAPTEEIGKKTPPHLLLTPSQMQAMSDPGS